MNRFACLLALSIIMILSETNSQWVRQTLPTSTSIISAIDFINQYHGSAVGYYSNQQTNETIGRAFYTTDSGINWITSTVSDSFKIMTDVQLMTENIGYASGNFHQGPFATGLFAETTDGGISWHRKGSLGYDVTYISKIHFTGIQTGYSVVSTTTGNRILKTTNSGNIWKATNSNLGLASFIVDIKFIDSLNGIAIGVDQSNFTQQGLILNTSNGGESWASQLHPEFGDINSVVYLDTTTILISAHLSSYGSVIYKSTDSGSTWNEFHVYNDHEFSIRAVGAIFNSKFIIAHGSYRITEIPGPPFIDVTFDSGFSWYTDVYDQFGFIFPSTLKIVDQNRWYLAGSEISGQGFVLYTDNGAELPVELTSFTGKVNDRQASLRWSTATELNNQGFEVQRKFGSNDFVTVGGVRGQGTTTSPNQYTYIDKLVDDGKYFYRLKQIDFSGKYEYSKIIEVDLKSLNNFALEQNYPNPFNPTTTIGYVLQEKGNTKLTLINLIGEEVAILVNEEQEKGYHKVEVNAANLPSGVYLYKLQAGNFTETKKLMLLK